MNTKEDFKKLVERLISLGEDKDELEYWQNIYDYLQPEQQYEIYKNLFEEFEALAKK